MNLTDLEQYLIESDKVKADDEYISDGIIVIHKNFIKNKILKSFKNTDKNILSDVPFDKGEEVSIGYGTHAKLGLGNRILIDINSEWFDYEFIKKLWFHLLYVSFATNLTFADIDCENQNVPILKFFDENDNFIGLIVGCKKND